MKVCVIVGRELSGILHALKRYEHKELKFGKFNDRVVYHYKPQVFQKTWKRRKRRKRVFEDGDYLIRNDYHFELFITHTAERETDAAATTQFLINQFAPDFIVNFGLAQKVNKNLERSLIYLVGAIIDYDYNVSEALGHYCPGVYPEQKSYLISTSSELSDQASHYKTNLGEEIPFAVCASGNNFIINESSKQQLLDQFKEIDICDMVSVGVYNTCELNKEYCLVIKGVTDNIHNGTVSEDIDFDRSVAVCFEETLNLLEFLH